MSRYIALFNWTDKGIGDAKGSPGRLDRSREMAKSYGCEIGQVFLTVGAYDFVVEMTAPDDASLAKFLIALGSQGNIRTTTLKAFSEDEYREIIGGV